MTTGWLDLPLTLLPTVDTETDLPATGSDGQAYVAQDTGVIYAWSSGEAGWIAQSGGGGGGGITSINSSSASSQFIVAGNGIVVASSGGSTTVSSSGAIPTIGPIRLFEDFNSFQYPDSTSPFGPMNLSCNGNVAHDGPTSSETNRYGIAEITSTDGTISGFSTDLEPLYAGSSTLMVAFAFNFGSNIATGPSNSWVSSWGTGNDYPATETGAFFKFNYLNPNFVCVNSLSSTTTEVDSGVAVLANTWYNFRIIMGPTSVQYFINGNLVANVSTNVPVGICGSIFAQFTQQTGAGVVAKIDWAWLSWMPITPRGTF